MAHILPYVIIVLSLIAVIYIGMVALVQTDMKKLVAYYSINHMGFVHFGHVPVCERPIGMTGIERRNHSNDFPRFCSAAMFMCTRRDVRPPASPAILPIMAAWSM